MEIRGVGGLNPIDKKNQLPKAVQATSTTKPLPQSDSLKVSDEARFLEDEAFIKEVLLRIPDIDQEKIDNVKNKLKNGDYNNKETIDALTEKLARALGL